MSKQATVPKQKQNTRKREHFPYEVIISAENSRSATELRDTTLTLCKAYRIPFNKISIWIPEKSQEKLFRETLLPGSFGKLLIGGSPCDYFEIGSYLVYMNCCIRGFFEYDSDSVGFKKPLKSLLGVLKSAFYECEKEKANLWGCVNLSNSKKILKPKISNKIKLISNTFWGTIYTGIDTGLKPSQDIERSILYYKKDGKILYLHNIGVKSCAEKDKCSEKDIKELLQKYPEFIVIDSGMKFILCDLRNKDKPK